MTAQPKKLRVLHTADWHIGRNLYGRKRYEEFEAFLNWLVEILEAHQIDILLIAGDVFDTTTPSNRAQALYYQFLSKAAATCCRHIVVIAGNHDSPTFLNAPKELLRTLNVHVVGSITEQPEDEVIILNNSENIPEAIICAVPYLRDKDVRTVEPGETFEDKNSKLIEGIRNHYEEVCRIADARRKELGDIPLLAMGHLFAAGGKTIDGDGVRDLYVGSLAYVGKDTFPTSIDYLALGHLHVPQKVGGEEHLRYSGSPIPMGFGEANQVKTVLLVSFDKKTPFIEELPIPCFQPLVRIKGSLEAILEKLETLSQEESHAWLEIEYTGSEIIPNLRTIAEEAVAGSAMDIRRIENRQLINEVLNSCTEQETLDETTPEEVFQKRLETQNVPHEKWEELSLAYKEVMHAILEEDVNAG
jgi:DNA repair protein SbcD/Mre11